MLVKPTNYTVPCIYQALVLGDGIGDLFHYIDFISALNQEELENAYFVISTNRDKEGLKILRDIIGSLPDSHPLNWNQPLSFFRLFQTSSKTFGLDASTDYCSSKATTCFSMGLAIAPWIAAVSS